MFMMFCARREIAEPSESVSKDHLELPPESSSWSSEHAPCPLPVPRIWAGIEVGRDFTKWRLPEKTNPSPKLIQAADY